MARSHKKRKRRVLCACGCGKYAKPGNKYIKGHQNIGRHCNLGRKHKEETKEKVRKTMLKLHREGKIKKTKKGLERCKKAGIKRAKQIRQLTPEERSRIGKKAAVTRIKNGTYERMHKETMERREAKRTLCCCGCGELAPYGLKYIPGHHRRYAKPNLFVFDGDICRIKIWLRSNGKRGKIGTYLGEALVDKEDYQKVKDYSWTMNKEGYAIRYNRKKKRDLLLHHEIIGNRWEEGLVVDHINRNRLDNRRSNLRHVSPERNSKNTEKRAGLRTTRYGGVYRESRKGGKYVGIIDIRTPFCGSSEEVLFKYRSEIELIKDLGWEGLIELINSIKEEIV